MTGKRAGELQAAACLAIISFGSWAVAGVAEAAFIRWYGYAWAGVAGLLTLVVALPEGEEESGSTNQWPWWTKAFEPLYLWALAPAGVFERGLVGLAACGFMLASLMSTLAPLDLFRTGDSGERGERR